MPSNNGSQHTDSSTTKANNLHGGEALLRALKGAPLSVLIALEMYGEQGRAELMQRTGWSRNAVTDALVQLNEMRLITRLHYRCWMLSAEQRLLPMLSAGEAERPSGNFSGTESTSRDLSAESPHTDLSCAESPSADLSESESPSRDLSAPHDHDGVIGNNDHIRLLEHHSNTNTRRAKRLARALQALDPPFENAERWLQEASPELVQGWLDYLQEIDRESRNSIRNEAAFIRWKVENEAQPPPRPKQRAPCEQCGRTIRDADGRCLVCLGVVAV